MSDAHLTLLSKFTMPIYIPKNQPKHFYMYVKKTQPTGLRKGSTNFVVVHVEMHGATYFGHLHGDGGDINSFNLTLHYDFQTFHCSVYR